MPKDNAVGMEANGLSGVLSEGVEPRCFYGHLCEDGNFTASGELELSGDYEKKQFSFKCTISGRMLFTPLISD